MDIGKQETIIRIPGKVKAKERPRRGRYGNFYTPPATQDYEHLVNWYALKSKLSVFSKDTFIKVEIIFYGKYGQSDIDNLIKTVLDGLKHFFNDNKVTKLYSEKIPQDEYLTEIKIAPVLNTP